MYRQVQLPEVGVEDVLVCEHEVVFAQLERLREFRAACELVQLRFHDNQFHTCALLFHFTDNEGKTEPIFSVQPCFPRVADERCGIPLRDVTPP